MGMQPTEKKAANSPPKTSTTEFTTESEITKDTKNTACHNAER